MFRYVKWFGGIGIILIAAYFVLQQASFTGADSHNLSDRITTLVMKIIVKIHGRQERSFSEISLIIRKLAHFMEYFLYASLTYGVARYLTKSWWVSLILTMILVLPIPYIDEVLIQTKMEGRAAHVFDMLIDYLAIGIALMTGVWYSLVQFFMQR